MHHGYWNGGGGAGWAWIPMVVLMVLVWGSVVWLGVTLLRRSSAPIVHHGPNVPQSPPPPPRPDPRQILAERLARGEIDVEEYRTRLDALDASRRDG